MLSSLIEKLKLVKDFRKKKGKRYQLWVVLSIIILGIITGNTNYKQIDKFKKREKENLIKLLKMPPRGLPSYSTIRRVMIGVDKLEMQLVLEDTVHQSYWQREELDWIAIDGKNLKNTLSNYENSHQNVLITVSMFSEDTKLVIKAESFESKQESEIAKVQDMIRKCGLKNKVFTLDALHCNKETTKTIIDSKNDYLITVKKNQIKLYHSLKELAELEKPLSVYQQKELSHGRKIKRKISVYNGEKVNHKNYPHLQSFLKVERLRLRGNKEYNETLYYISSRKLSAEIFAQRIKGHWSIENQLHWVKDVIFKEDKSRFKIKQAAANFSALVTLVMNLYRSLGFISITEGQDWLGNNWEKLLTIEGINSS